MKTGRNDPCPCGSGRKYKRCCGSESAATAAHPLPGPNEIGALVSLVQQERLAEAEQRAGALLKSHPDVGMLWKILGIALLRQGKDPLQALRRTTELLPQDAEAHANLGGVLHDQGRWAEALTSLHRALELRPRDLDTLICAANATKALGRARESVALYQRALQIDPRSAEGQNNLGNAFLELAQCADAVACYCAALQIKPDNAEVHCNLGNALRQLGQLQEAVECSQRALTLEPGLSVAHNNLGLCLAALGRRAEAAASYRQALRLSPAYVDALDNLGNVLRELGERDEALSLHQRAVTLDPARAHSHRGLGDAMFEFRRIGEAEASYRRALALQPGQPPVLVSLAAALRMQGRAAEAQADCEAALTADPQCIEALCLLGELHADSGRFPQAHELFERAIALDPGVPSALCGVAAHRKMTRADTTWLQNVQALLAKPLPLAHEINLRYALGKYYDDAGEYDEAFRHYRQANELTKRPGARYEREKLTRRVDRIIGGFDTALIRQCQAHGSTSEQPVFIVGMPRSGTSLVEQIGASHPEVFGAGELRFWDTAFAALERTGFEGSACERLVPDLARDYLDHSRAANAAGALRVIDKMPANFLYAGLIHAVFPRARVIHMRRHPIDTCLSIYFQNFFNVSPYANDLEDLAHYYAEYDRVTAHWRALLPATAWLEIPYEGLVADQEGWTRRLLEFLALPWDPRCLEFHRTERIVITASKWQVRQRMHAASAGRWRHYEKHVGPLRRLMSGPV
jgi:tetratricopeptide (TPR) repeat protein